MMKNKKKIKKIIFSLAFIGVFCLVSATFAQAPMQGPAGTGTLPLTPGTDTHPPAPAPATPIATTPAGGIPATGSGGAYTNQEKIPGAEPTSEFIPYLKSIINFGFAIIGILALFMLIIGAYQYLMAAGSGKADSAKETISSALLGLVLGLCAWIILNKINPDLVNMNSITQISGGGSGNTASPNPAAPAGGGAPSANAGKCTVTDTGNCSASAMSCFGDQARNASSVCMCESGGQVKIGGDKCNGTNVSSGLLQMNTTCHNLGMNCSSAYNGCLGTNVSNSTCKILNPGLAQQCMAAMQNPTSNIQAACQLQKTGGWGHWTCARTCGVI